MDTSAHGPDRSWPGSDLQRIIDSTPALIHTARPDGYHDFFNKTCLNYVGCSLEDLQGMKWTASIHSEDVEGMVNAWRTSLASGEPFLYEARVRSADGQYRWMLHQKVAVRDEQQNIVKWYGTSIDIEDRKRAEQSFRLIVETIPGLIAVMTPQGEVEHVNHQVLDYFGRTLEELKKWGTTDAVHPVDLPGVVAAWQHAVETGLPYEVEHRLRRADGEYRWFVSRGLALRDANGHIVRWYNLLTDIHVRKQSEEELRRSEERFRLVLESIGVQVIATTLEGELDFVNQPALDYFGKTMEQLKGWRTTDVIHRDDLASAIAVWKDSIEKGLSYNVDHRFRRSDGVYRWFHVRGRPQRDAQGSIVRWYALLTDIDERKRAEQKLGEQEGELRQILDLAPQLVAVYGPNREPLYANRVLLDYFGQSLEEWRQSAGNVHPDDNGGIDVVFGHSVTRGSADELELRLRKLDGSYRWFLARFNPLRDELGQITRWYITGTDIDDRKQAEDTLRRENVALREEIDKASMFEEIVGTSPALKAVLSRISKVAPSDSTVLITGETGTGKELVARAIHRRSDRSSRAFISVNCAAIPHELIASELFGHEKGAFTGATQQRLGRFELANGGTIFLDEVGELPAETQIALLRVLQEHEFERVGGTRPIRADVRVIAATNRDLQAAIGGGSFRSDLFYRLHVFPIEIPALRERKEDILLLVEYFIDRYARKAGKKITTVDKKTLRLLESYPWPGNIRELQNVIERSVIVCETENFSVDESWLSKDILPPTFRTMQSGAFRDEVEPRSEREIIEAALAETRGRVSGPSGAAAKLRIPPSTLETRIKALKINKGKFKFR